MQVLNSAAAGEALEMSNGYFFRLLEHMTAGALSAQAASKQLRVFDRLQLWSAGYARARLQSPLHGNTQSPISLSGSYSLRLPLGLLATTSQTRLCACTALTDGKAVHAKM